MTLNRFTVILTVSAFLFLISPFMSSDIYAQEFWGNLAEFLNKIYGTDNNTGLTTLPVLNVPMGGRAEGMAGSFSAVSDDISFIEYNPAGSSMLEKTELAFFHNNWIADSRLEGAAFSTRFRNLGVGAGFKWLYMPFTQYNLYGQRVSSGYYSEGVAILNVSHNFFNGFYFKGLSLGINLKGAFRIVPDYADSENNIIANSGKDQSAFTFMADIGLLTRINLFKFYAARDRNMSFALVMRNLGPPAMGDPLPTVLNAAISYKPIRPLLLAFDFYLPMNLTNFSLSEKIYGSFGVSLQATRFLSMRTGMMLKPGSSRFTIGSEIIFNKIALDINYTLDLLTQLQPLNRFSIGVRFDMGDKGRKEISNRVDDLYLLGLEAYTRDNITDAKLCWQEALRLDPGYDPAKESLLMLENRESLIQSIEDLFFLDF